jgi:transcriptional pleiotropic regulator of transition state genes
MSKKTNIRRAIKQGKLVVPPEIVRAANWEEGTEIEFIIDKNQIILKPYEYSCIFCGNATDDIFYGKPVCMHCRFQIVQGTKYIHEINVN